MGPRSLAAIFGKLDREENLGWLAGRPEVQLELARVLGTSRQTLRLALAPATVAEPRRLVTWDAMPYARVLDLAEEQLFPGVPSEALRPGAWERLVWVAPNGGGRSLVGRWLEARGLAEHVAAPRIRDAALPRARPLFVELGTVDGLDLDRLAPGVCVAVPEPFPRRSVPSGVRVVRSPPIAEVLDELLAWCRARLSAQTGLDESRMARWLRKGHLESGAVESVGDVLGLVGLGDALGMEALETRPLARIAEEFVRRRGAERLDPDGPSTPWARRAGFDALVAILRRFLVDEELPFLGRSTEEWSLVLPAELKQGPDLDWLRAALPGADPRLLRSDVERAVTKLPPGAFRLLRTFEALGLFERSPDGLLALRPHWLARAAASVALSEIALGPPAGWGEALLSPKAAPALAGKLLSRAREGKLALEDFHEAGPDDSPVHAAATEGAFRAVGLARLLGTEAAPDAAEALWDETLRLVFEPPGALPAPRIDLMPLDPAEPNAWMLGRGAFAMAALALGEELEAGQGRAHALLRPWRASKAPPGLPGLLDVVRTTLEHPATPPELAGAVSEMVARLRSVVGPLGEGAVPHSLERAAMIADETALGVLAWPSLVELARDAVSRRGVRQLVASRKLEKAFADAVWQAHRDAGSPLGGTEALFSPELAPLVLPGAPGEALGKLLPLLLEHDEAAALVAERLPALVETAPDGAPLALFRRVPESALDALVALAARAERDDAMRELWARFPEALAGRAHGLLVGTDDASARTLAVLLRSAPLESTEALARALDDVDALMKSPGETLSAVRALLHARIGARARGWREAYGLFSEIEKRCQALRVSTRAPQSAAPKA